MIQVELSRNEFEYDVRSLLKAFYPEETVRFGLEDQKAEEKCLFMLCVDYAPSDIVIHIEKDGVTAYCGSSAVLNRLDDKEDTNARKNYKNILKRLLYQALVQITGKELLWGTLTGIRPVKIPMKLIEENKSVFDIKSYMREEYLCSEEKTELCVRIAETEHQILNSIDYKNGCSVYIGIPFCPSTCLYCSFTSYSISKYADYVEAYLTALFKEIDFAAGYMKDKKLCTIYLGGGTPTTLSAEQLERLLIKINTSFSMENVRELTVEAGRPDSITLDKLIVLKEQGVTRISINPQTMNQKTLDVIGRKHTAEQIISAFWMARKAGHDNINMDIILSLPGECCSDVEHTLKEIDLLKPDSLTVHTLAKKRAADLNIFSDRYKNMICTDTKEMLLLTKEYAKEAGYYPYYLYRQKNMAENLENVGYAKEKKEGIYNILIMEEKHTILALGAGASSKFVFAETDRIERSENVKSVKDYIERVDEMIQRKRAWMEGNQIS